MWAVSLTWMNHTSVQLFTGSITLAGIPRWYYTIFSMAEATRTVRLVSPPSGRVSWQRYLSLSIYIPSWLSSVMLSWLNILQASLFTPEILLCLGFFSALRLGSVIFTEKQNPFIELGAPCRTVIIATCDLKATVAIVELK